MNGFSKVVEAVQIATAAAQLDGAWDLGMPSFGEYRSMFGPNADLEAGDILYWCLLAQAQYGFESGDVSGGLGALLTSICYALDWATSGDPIMEERGLRWLSSETSRIYLRLNALQKLSPEQLSLIRIALVKAGESVADRSNCMLNRLSYYLPKCLSASSIAPEEDELRWILEWHKGLNQAVRLRGPELRSSIEKLRRDELELKDDWFAASMNVGDLEVVETRYHCRSVLGALTALLGEYLGKDQSGIEDPQGGIISVWRDGPTIKVMTSGQGFSRSELFALEVLPE